MDTAKPMDHLFSWMPSEKHNNARLDYLKRILINRGMPEDQADENARNILKGLWNYLTATGSAWQNVIKKVNHQKKSLNCLCDGHEFWKVDSSPDKLSDWMICNKCHNIYPIGVDRTCMTYSCMGKLEPLDKHEDEIRTNLYRTNYLSKQLFH